MLYIQFWVPGDGWRYRLKHVEHFTEINKLCNVASCWLYLEIYLRCTDLLTSDIWNSFSDSCIADPLLDLYEQAFWSRVITEKIPADEEVKKFLTFLETRRFINVFTTPLHPRRSVYSFIWIRNESLYHISAMNIITYFSPFSVYCLPLLSKYSLQLPVLKVGRVA
jgi:hypothetical protein